MAGKINFVVCNCTLTGLHLGRGVRGVKSMGEIFYGGQVWAELAYTELYSEI